MNSDQATPSQPRVDLHAVFESVDRNSQRLFEIAETFRQDAAKFLIELKSFANEGRKTEAVHAASSLLKTSNLVNAQPLDQLAQQALDLANQDAWTELMAMTCSLETAVQGTINLLRKEDVLKASVRLPEPIVKGDAP